MRKLFFVLSILLLALMPAAAFCAEPEVQDALPDLSTLRNPFLSPFPKVIVKTPVESTEQKVDNTDIMSLAPAKNSRASQPGVVLPPFRLQGIIWGTDRPQAIINDNVYGVGDVVDGGVRINSIQQDGVDVLFGGEKFHVPMDQ